MQSLVFWIYLLALFSLYNDIEDMMHSMLHFFFYKNTFYKNTEAQIT